MIPRSTFSLMTSECAFIISCTCSGCTICSSGSINYSRYKPSHGPPSKCKASFTSIFSESWLNYLNFLKNMLFFLAWIFCCNLSILKVKSRAKSSSIKFSLSSKEELESKEWHRCCWLPTNKWSPSRAEYSVSRACGERIPSCSPLSY